MNKYSLLECTLRDGGYINGWNFGLDEIKDITSGLCDSNFDFVEVGYLNHKEYAEGSTQFSDIEMIADYLPKDRGGTFFLAMADVLQFEPKDITPYTGRSIDGIRVVFYKHQIDQAFELGRSVIENGYRLFMQPMVTIDYSMNEFAALIKRICELHPYAVYVVDSFGYMIKSDFRRFFRTLDNFLPIDVTIGFHSHNNMNLALLNAQDILEYITERRIIIDSTLYGMGRGAGNLHTELIANYYNLVLGEKYDVDRVMDMIGKYILPIYEKRRWGYSPYYLITALHHCHPNYVAYLLEDKEVSVSDFRQYINTIPKDMFTRCKKDYVLDMYSKFEKDSI